MSAIGSIISCPEIQDTLNNEFGNLTGQVPITDMLVPFLISDINTQNVLQTQVNAGNNRSRIRTVELVYQQRMVESEISTTSVLNCDGGDAPGEFSTQYTIQEDEGVAYSWSITPNDLIRNCRDNNTWVVREIQRVFDGLVRKMNTVVADEVALNTGDFLNGDTERTTQTKQSGVDPAYDLIEDVRFAFEELEFAGTPFLFGFGEAKRYFNRVQAACCADIGMDLFEYAQNNEVVFMKDKKIPTSLGGSDKFMAMAPGAIQLLTWNEFKDETGVVTFNDDTYVQGTLVDPRTGLEFDYFAEFDCGTWNFQLKLAFQTVYLPTDLFQPDDDLSGTNWVLKFDISNP